MDFLSQSAAILSFVSFALGVSVWSRGPSDRLNRWFGVLCFWITAWSVFFFLSSVWSMYSHYRSHLVLNLGLGPVGLRFVRYLVRERRFGFKLEYAALALSGVLGIALIFGLEAQHTWIQQLVYFAPSLLLIRVVQIAWSERSLGMRRLWVYLGAISTLLLCCMDHIPALGRIVPGIGNLALTVYLFFLAHRITRSRMLSAQTLSSKFLVIAMIDAAGIYREILETVFQSLHPDWIALYVLRPDGTTFKRVSSKGREPVGVHAPLEVMRDFAIAHDLRYRLEHDSFLPVIWDVELRSELSRALSKVDRDRHIASDHALSLLGCDVALALYRNHELYGFVALRSRSALEGASLQWSELALLDPFLSAAGSGLSNLGVFLAERERERLVELGEMAAGLAHEIRNPLGVIRGAAQVLSTSSNSHSSQQNQKLLQAIVKETDRMNGVVTQFLDYARPSPQDHCDLELSQVIRAAIHQWADLEHNRTLIFIGQTEEIWIHGSELQLVQVIRNLVQNSIQSVANRSSEKGYVPEVRVELAVVPVEGGQQAVVHVFDNGTGIDQENLGKIFVPFFTTKAKGTGLGLSVSQRIMLAHRGRIEVQSEAGKYAKFSLVFPHLPGEKGGHL